MINKILKHKNVYEDDSRIATKIPLTPALREIHKDGYFPLIEDPKKTGKTAFIGMFVLRPAKEAWTEQVVKNGTANSLYDVEAWTFNIRGLDGGWMIANKNPMDGYRLALQYGLADAVFVGSTTATVEGIPNEHNGNKGYVWHPYNPTSWPQIKEADPEILQKIMEQRKEFQNLGYLSERKYPAQVIVTQSGKPGNPDILEASIFHETDPDGKQIEAYILTSLSGAKRIRERAKNFNLEDRIEKILITSSLSDSPDLLNLRGLPELLYNKYNMMIANHDGGATVLSQFAKAGILPQMNLTLTRKRSLYDVLQAHKFEKKEQKSLQQQVLEDFDNRTDKFFGTENGKIPKELIPVHIIADNIDEATVVTFDSRALTDKGFR